MDKTVKMFDPLKSYDSLTTAGLADKEARAIVAAIQQSNDDAFNNLATKDDLKMLEVKTQSDLKQVETHLRQDINQVEVKIGKIEGKLELLVKVNLGIFLAIAVNILMFWLRR